MNPYRGPRVLTTCRSSPKKIFPSLILRYHRRYNNEHRNIEPIEGTRQEIYCGDRQSPLLAGREDGEWYSSEPPFDTKPAERRKTGPRVIFFALLDACWERGENHG